MLVPRLVLFRQRQGRYVPKEQLQDRFRKFERGEWLQLLRMSQDVSARSASRSFRSRGREREEEARAARALSLVYMEELSAARQALEGAPVAPDSCHSRALTDPKRRPALAREPLRAEIANFQPAVPFQLNTDLPGQSSKIQERSCPGPSGMNSDHLFPLLERPVLGAPIGHPQYVQEFLRRKSEEQQVLFERIPLVDVRVHPHRFLAPDGVP